MSDFDREFYTATFWLGVLFILGCITIGLSGCGSTDLGPLCEAPPIAADSQYVVNGSPSTDRRSTVFVKGGDGYCSGTVVGPHTVLTAAHCAGMHLVCLDFNSACIEVVDELQHPLYNFPLHDIHLLYVPDLPVFGLPVATLGDHSECVRQIAQGYGYGSDGELHERVVEHVYRDGSTIYGSESICNGDSGGPLYAVDSDGSTTLIGVSSFGLNEPNECIGGAVGFVDLTTDNKIEWIEENLR
jgi:secreted trypsin-like serine protease